MAAAASLVVIMGTQYFDGSGATGGQDYPVTDLLQMMGRASRPDKDESGRCVFLLSSQASRMHPPRRRRCGSRTSMRRWGACCVGCFGCASASQALRLPGRMPQHCKQALRILGESVWRLAGRCQVGCAGL